MPNTTSSEPSCRNRLVHPESAGRPMRPSSQSRREVLATESTVATSRMVPNAKPASRSLAFSSTYARVSFGSPKMLRTAIRAYVIQPIAVQIRPARATAPVHPNRLVLDVAMSVSSSVEMMPSSPMRPGA
jgi:hypothetical protein